MAASRRELAQRDFPHPIEFENPNPAIRVLLLDDEGHVLRVLRSIIESLGFDVVTALNADSAMQAVLDCACDVLIISGELASASARPICQCAQERLAEKSPLILVLDGASFEWADQFAFVRSLSMPFSCKSIVDCLSEEVRQAEVGQAEVRQAKERQ